MSTEERAEADGGLSALTGELEPKPPNDSGSTQCIVRWMVETPSGWLGAWDRNAFSAYVDAAVRAERDACAAACAALRSEWARMKIGAMDGRYDMMEDAASACEDEILLRSNAPVKAASVSESSLEPIVGQQEE